MNRLSKTWLTAALLTLLPLAGRAADNPAAVPAPQVRDGQHDFDFGTGVWKTHIRRLLHPLTGSTEWAETSGTVTTRKLWDGKGQLEELVTNGPGGDIEGITVRLYDPAARQWKLYWVDSGDGTLGQPVVGAFQDGVGTFYDQEEIGGRDVWVRNVYYGIGPKTYKFEQAFSADGGKTWEANFMASLTQESPAVPEQAEAPGLSEPQHAFDWQFGDWDVHMSRLKAPLTGSNTWIPMDGSVVVKRIWGGKANVAEIDVQGASGPLQFLSLRLYNPAAKQWSLNFAGSGDGTFGVPEIGAFKDGRGDFYDQEPYADKTIMVRFSFLNIGTDSARDEQAFSGDYGKTWEVNWVNLHKRMPAAPGTR
ncbi:MAG TPA: hypothetical protein VFK21_06220 [Gammaproteobacteria bacterium]|nr:hypothetical protein [Gammaproteobacteria bacterium]